MNQTVIDNWVSVKDRLPGKEDLVINPFRGGKRTMVLCKFDKGLILAHPNYGVCDFISEAQSFIGDSDWIVEPTHWMKIPQ